MKKIIIFSLTVVLISVVFAVPVSAETENSNLYLSDLPVICTSSNFTGNPIYFYNIYQNYSDYSVNGLLTVLPLVKINGEWCYLSRNDSTFCTFIQFGFDGTNIKFYSASVSPSSENATNWTFRAILSYSDYLILTYGFDYGSSNYLSTPISISSGSSVSVSSLPSTIAWVVMGTDYTDTSDSNTLSYLRGKNVHNSDVSEGGSNFSCNAKFLCFEDYPEVSPDSFESHISSGNTGIGSVFENGHTVRFYYQDDPSYVLLGDNTSYKTYNSSYISLQIQTDDSPDTSYYIRVDRAYFNNRGSNDVVGYFFRSPCVDLIQKFAVIQPESFKRLESNSTYTYKINLSGFIPLNYFSVYNISVYSMSDGLLTSTSICYVGSDQSAEPDPSNSVDVFFKHDDGRIDGEPLIPDDSGLMEDLPDGIQDTSLKHYNSDYSYDITEITDTLETSVAQTSAFVDVLWGLVPAEIMVIIVAGVALLIILRILGR